MTNLFKNIRFFSNTQKPSKVNEKTVLEGIVFSRIKSILDNNPINSDTQVQIETLVRNQYSEFFKNKSSSHRRRKQIFIFILYLSLFDFFFYCAI